MSTGWLFAEEIPFEYLNTSNGLSQNTVNCIMQDSQGFIWIGTNDGLNRYDGYEFITYQHNFQDSTTLSDSKVYTIMEDKAGNLWVGTRCGLNIYHRDRDLFIRYHNNPHDPNSISNDFVRNIYMDTQGNIWICTLGGGLNKYAGDDIFKAWFKRFDLTAEQQELSGNVLSNVTSIVQDQQNNYWLGSHWAGLIQFFPERESFRFYPFQADSLAVKDNYGKTVYQDLKGDLWICTEGNGLFLFDQNKKKFSQFRHHPDQNSINNNIVKDMKQISEDLYWIATDGGGLDEFDRSTGLISHHTYDIKVSNSISSNGVYSIFKDNQDIVWVGTFGAGINIFDQNKKRFRHYTQEVGNPFSLSHKAVLSFLEDRQGNIWVGTDGGGLNLFDRQSGRFKTYKAEPDQANRLSSNAVTSIYQDRDGNLWLGTYAGGLNHFDPEREEFTAYNKDKSCGIINNNIWDILEDQKHRLWLGSSGGLMIFDRNKGKFKHVQNSQVKKNPFQERIVSIFEDHQGVIWAGGIQLNYFDEKEQSLVPFEPGANWGRYDIRCITEDAEHNLWIGTEGGGMIKIDPERKRFTKYGANEGLPNNAVHQILQDGQGFLWLSTNKGLARFDPRTGQVRNFDKNDGLQGDQFSYSAAMKSSSGEMYFGGINGFNVFLPDSIKDNPHLPRVLFTDFLIANKKVSIDPTGKDSPLTENINKQKKVVLKHNQSFITFEFTALNFTSSQKNRYAYYLEGFETEWNEPNYKRSVTYTNLDPGNYTFHVKASNNDDLWNEAGNYVELVILPPFWKTTWAYLLYSLIFIGLIYSFRKYLLDKAQYKHDIKIQELEKEKIQKINQTKINFFTNISHEFKTPLTLILSPLEQLLHQEKLDQAVKGQLNLMHQNGKRLLHLINQLMDFKKLEKRNMALKVERGDIIQFLKNIKLAFNDFAVHHRIDYQFITPKQHLVSWFDADKLDKIFYNLLSNAFKFTHDGGAISMRITLTQRPMEIQGMVETVRFIEVYIQDNGIGIPAERQNKIFERFYKIPNADHLIKKLEQEGSGIGLSLTRELVEIHYGGIVLESDVGKGSTFKVSLPIDEKVYNQSKPVVSADVFDLDALKQHEQVTHDQALEIDQGHFDKDKDSLLIVEDNKDLLYFMVSSLSDQYNILLAQNGKEAYELARKKLPDLIISDVMMPVMNGFELCKKLKSSPVTSHIPIIMLTAKTSVESNIFGFENGADEYMAKPFSMKVLKSRIVNLIASRRMMRERYRKLMIQPEETKIPSADDHFLTRALQVVENQIANPEFDVNQFALEMGMSRSVFYRKMRAIADQSANEFIISIRLKRAAQLLKKSKLTISEITYQVGFNDPQYFSKCFKKQYKTTPSVYANLHQEASSS
ncbi:MAG: hybrid sensor histidine kinase/response regulator transcription factor [Candidatus Cyclobacteriaceae bacterium M3_2C_046]